ncbi:hypothetical protein AAH979_12600 [Plantactinospora sp. ZYX-F-223]|uniref:hypothetical protein n=1 Tax=Plantactinospora sp. ZYX-F-223 TaxID=3144103 RepID=UPI0031FD9241
MQQGRLAEADLAFLDDAEAALLDGAQIRIPAARLASAGAVPDGRGAGLAEGA